MYVDIIKGNHDDHAMQIINPSKYHEKNAIRN